MTGTEFGDIDEGTADLHTHTTASDGTSTVAERVEQARARGLEAVAVTDHDRISDELEVRSRTIGGVELITGVEVKAEARGTKVEILGYYVEPSAEELNELLGRVRKYRKERNREMTDRFVTVTGIETSYEEMCERADGSLGRPHFARLLVEEGFVETVSEAFDEYLGEDGDVYVPSEKVGYEAVIDAVHDAGGVASLAHPGRIDAETDEIRAMVAEMVEAGLDGIEVWYPYGEIAVGRGSDVGVEEARELAEEHDLLRTGGSDCHGEGSEKFRIGDVRVPAEDLRRLRAESSVRVEGS
ncbi:MAG: PHP domain-containing protein [Halobacteriales archaeon]|nr:PHP domain-containing protein [Halobacteriales archaeon]